MENNYLKRIADCLLQERLLASSVVLIEGPKWCGKTRTALENSKSHLFMQDPDRAVSYLKAADCVGTLGCSPFYGGSTGGSLTIHFNRISGSKG